MSPQAWGRPKKGGFPFEESRSQSKLYLENPSSTGNGCTRRSAWWWLGPRFTAAKGPPCLTVMVPPSGARCNQSHPPPCSTLNLFPTAKRHPTWRLQDAPTAVNKNEERRGLKITHGHAVIRSVCRDAPTMPARLILAAQEQHMGIARLKIAVTTGAEFFYLRNKTAGVQRPI